MNIFLLIKKLFLNSRFLIILLLMLIILGVAFDLAAEGNDVPTVKYTSQNLRDPFKSPWEIEKMPVESSAPVEFNIPHLNVQGVVWGSPMPQAIINNTVVTPGESIGNAEVLDVRKEGVYVLYQGKQYILRPKV